MMMSAKSKDLRKLFAAGAAISVLALAGCATSTGDEQASLGGADLPVQAGGGTPTGLDPLANAAFWGTRYDRSPNDKEAGLNFARALRQIGSLNEALSVLERMEQAHPGDADVRFEFGKALVADARAYQGLRYLQQAAASRPEDWRVRSAYGVALDQIGEHREAQAQYDAALRAAPGEPTLLNNKGLSLALAGRLTDAELVLREAVRHPQAGANVRQNLALVLGYKGDLAEAERLARADLPPQAADGNMAYYRQLFNQPAYWNDLMQLDAVEPEAPAAAPAPAVEVPDGPPVNGAPLKN